MPDLEEASQSIQRLQKAYEDLAVRGLRSVSGDQLNTLKSIKEEMERVGAAHLAGRIETLLSLIRSNDRGAARELMRAQSSLRVFDRILTMQGAEAQFAYLLARADGEDGLDDDELGEGSDDDDDVEEDD